MKSYLETLIDQQQQLISQQACLIELNKQLLAGVSALASSQPAGLLKPEKTEKLYNRKEAAAYLLVHPRSVTRYRLSGRLKAVCAHDDERRIRYREEDLRDCYFWKWGKLPS